MSAFGRALRGTEPDPSELISIRERAGYLEGLRAGIAAMVVGAMLLAPAIVEVSGAAVLSVTLVYLALSLLPRALRRFGKARVLPFLGATLLLDGIYLAWIVYATGGATSALRFLLLVHIVVVTLLMSYRTGLKIALWNTLLFILIVSFRDVSDAASADPASSADGAALLMVLAMWMAAIATSTLSAIKERELRGQKADLEHLAAMVKELDASSDAKEMPGILLRHLQESFPFSRGLVLASPEGELELVATTFDEDLPEICPGMDPLMERAWAVRESQLVRRLDPATDPRLAAMLPDARDLLIVPLFLDRGFRLGLLVLEFPGARDTIKRWVVSMVGQFASHAALALHNAWLLAREEEQLREIRSLQAELLSHNATLELTVLERTEELRKVISDLEEADEQRRMLLSHVVQAQEEERVRIANDIHDDPVQKMVAAKMRLELLRRTVDPDHHELIGSVEDAVRTSIRSIRHLLFDLRPPILDEQGLGPALERFLENSEIDFGFVVENGLENEPPPETRVILYRIAQEALTNARKHSRADQVEVVLRHRDQGVLMRIADDGVGFSPQHAVVAAPGHLGLGAMRERAEMAGGSCDLHSLPGGGTTVEVWLPIDAGSPQGADDATGQDRVAYIEQLRGRSTKAHAEQAS